MARVSPTTIFGRGILLPRDNATVEAYEIKKFVNGLVFIRILSI